MIRFCDKEVYCVFQDSLDRDLILKYFFNGHMDDIICIMDEAGSFKGKITYYSLINSQNIYKSIMKEYVILDENIWNNAKEFFKNYDITRYDRPSVAADIAIFSVMAKRA